MYSQFVAGETLPAIQDTVKMLRDCGIGTMLCVPNEEDLSTDYENFRDRWGLANINIACMSDFVTSTVIRARFYNMLDTFKMAETSRW